MPPKAPLAVALLACISQLAAAQAPAKVAPKLNANSVYVVDSVTLESAAALRRYDAATIAIVDVFTGPEAVQLLGERGRNGIVYAETIPFVRRRYWRYFSQKSPEYKALLPTPAADSVVQYVLNKRILTKKDIGDLSLINDEIFKSLRIVDAQTLATAYGVTGKKYGVVLEASRPKYLYHGRKEF